MNRFFYKMRRATLFLFLFVLPVGIRLDPEHPNEFSVSVGMRYHLPFGTSEMSPEQLKAAEEEANKKSKPVDVR